MPQEWLATLIEQARGVRRHAYAPYSQFTVGAALLDTSDRIHVGCNVENGSYGLTQCAERAAITSAIAAGSRAFRALVIVSTGHVAPCGACRQVLSEFCDDLPIWLVDAESTAAPEMGHATSLDQLLPLRFRLQR